MIHIVSGADERFAPGLLAVVASALFSLPSHRSVTFHILDGGLAKNTVARLRALAKRLHPDCQMVFCPVDEMQFAGYRAGIGNSRMYYARLGIGEMICADKVIYLDADVVITGPLAELWDMEINSYLLLAARDRKICFLRDDCPWPLSREEEVFPYFNTGVLLVNLRRWREENTGTHAMSLAAEVGNQCQWYDQTVINYMLRGKIGLLPDLWNWQRELLSQEMPVAVIHFTTEKKPWLFLGSDMRFRIWRAFYFFSGGSRGLFFQRKAIPGLFFGVFEMLLQHQPLLRRCHVALLKVFFRAVKNPATQRAIQGSILHYTSARSGEEPMHPVISKLHSLRARS